MKANKLLIALLLTAAVGLRVFHITADAPPPVPEDGAFMTDQGWYSHNALYKIQTGSWFYRYDQNEILHTALFSFIQYGVFRVCGVHLWAARIQPIVFSTLTIVLAFWFFRRYGNPRSGDILLLLMACNYLHIMYSRAVLVEPTVGFFMLAGFICWYRSREASAWLAAAAAAGVFCAFWAKSHGLVMAGVLAAVGAGEFFIFDRKDERLKLLLRLALFFSVLGVLYGCWKIMWLERSSMYLETFDYLSAPRTFTSFRFIRERLVAGLLTVHFLTIRMPVLVALAGLAAGAFILGIRNGGRKYLHDRYLAYMVVVWLLFHLGFFAFYGYIRPRFLMLSFVPLVYCASTALSCTPDTSILNRGAGRFWPVLLWLAVSAVFIFKMNSPKTSEPLFLIAVALAVVTVLLLTIALWPERLENHKVLKGLLAGCLILQIIPYAAWAATPRYSIVRNGRHIRAVLEKNGDRREYVKGPLAPTFALEGNFLSLEAQTPHLLAKQDEYYRPAYCLVYDSAPAPDGAVTEAVMDYTVFNSWRSSRHPRQIVLYRLPGRPAAVTGEEEVP